jgi:hypothetical protein
VTTDGVWIGNRIYWTLQHTTRDYISQITITHRLVFSVVVVSSLLGNGFQRRAFPSSGSPNCPPPQLPASIIQVKVKACYDRRSVGQSVLGQVTIPGPYPYFYYCHTVVGLLNWGTLSDERMGLSFTISAGPRQRRHSQVRVPRDS